MLTDMIQRPGRRTRIDERSEEDRSESGPGAIQRPGRRTRIDERSEEDRSESGPGAIQTSAGS